MSISAISSSPVTAALTQTGLAPDGDSKAKEATESAALQAAEKANGGQAPKSPAAVTATTSTTPGGVNKLV